MGLRLYPKLAHMGGVTDPPKAVSYACQYRDGGSTSFFLRPIGERWIAMRSIDLLLASMAFIVTLASRISRASC